MSAMSIIPRLSILIPTLLALWLATVVALHGPAMIAYVVMHACTTGLFAWGMWKTEKKYASHSGNGSQSTGLLTKPQASDQKSGQEVAVAS